MASISKLENRKSKPWQVRIRRQGKTIVEYFRTRREAAHFSAKVEADFNKWSRLLGGELKRHTVGELIDRFMVQWAGKDVSLLARMAWWKERYGDRPLSEFSGDAVREGLAMLEEGTAKHGGNVVTDTERKRSPATINRYRTAISSAFKTAIDKGWFGVTENPAVGIRLRKEDNSRFGRSLDDEERGRLLLACDQSTAWSGLGLFVRLALATGARRGELLKLKWRNVDLREGSVFLRDTKNKDDRRVPLIGEARTRLEEWSKVRRLDDPRVFPGSRPGTSPLIDAAWREAKRVAGVENLRIHDLRHSCGTYLARAGANAFQIAAVLGHRSGPSLTARYVHLVAEDSRELLEGALGGVLGGVGNEQAE